MGIRVNTNVASLAAQRNLSVVSMRLEGNFRRLASGLRISTGADDAAGLAISERMRARIQSYGAASRNALDGVSLVQTAEGALAEVNASLSRMRELAIQSANGTLNTDDRAVLDEEFQALIEEIDRVADTTEFNEIDLLNSSTGSVSILVGADSPETITISLVDVTESALNLTASTVAVDTATNASAVISIIDTAIESINTARGNMGAQQNRLDSARRSIENARENLSAAESRIRDVDVAAEMADLTRNTIVQQAAATVLAQANLQPQIALGLLQG